MDAQQKASSVEERDFLASLRGMADEQRALEEENAAIQSEISRNRERAARAERAANAKAATKATRAIDAAVADIGAKLGGGRASPSSTRGAKPRRAGSSARRSPPRRRRPTPTTRRTPPWGARAPLGARSAAADGATTASVVASPSARARMRWRGVDEAIDASPPPPREPPRAGAHGRRMGAASGRIRGTWTCGRRSCATMQRGGLRDGAAADADEGLAP